jgi:Fur family ferric uptake transcriptional regulator
MNAKIIKLLEDSKIKPTPMRMLVLEQLILQQQNLSLTDIEDLLYPSDRITIYRTLQTFIQHGLVHSIDTISNGSIYALCSEDCKSDLHLDNHPHFYCESCKQVTCNDDFSYTVEIKPNSPQYRLNKVEINLKGLCPSCVKG